MNVPLTEEGRYTMQELANALNKVPGIRSLVTAHHHGPTTFRATGRLNADPVQTLNDALACSGLVARIGNVRSWNADHTPEAIDFDMEAELVGV